MRKINWNEAEGIAKKMKYSALEYAYYDCVACSKLGMINDGYYSDCASVYYREMKKR